MRRADRLFQIILLIGNAQSISGNQIARSMGVTVRTVYRDIRDLIKSGVPIQGEAGVGYRMKRGYQIPPLMFTDEEMQSLYLGVSIVRAWADVGMASASAQVLAKVEAVLPAAARPKMAYGAMIVPGQHVPAVISDNLSALRGAISLGRKVAFSYPRPFAERIDRVVQPLILAYWGGCWTLGAWCEFARDFRTFRVDGVYSLRVLTETFERQESKLLDYFAATPEHDAVLGEVVDALKNAEKKWPSASSSN